MKIALIIWVTLGNGSLWSAPATYFETEAACTQRMVSIMSHKYPFKVNAFCANIIEEVDEK